MTGVLPRRVFVVGCPRSGTTLLQALLAAHPRVTSFPESHFFRLVKSRHRVARVLRLASPAARRRLVEYADAAGLGEVPAPPRLGFERQYATWLARSFDAYALRNAQDVWVEKTPGHLAWIPEIEKLFRGARFIHVVRDGADVVASLHEVTSSHPAEWGGARGIDRCINRWLRDVSTTARYLGRPNHLVVRYEQLVERPEPVLCQVCAFVGVEFSDAMVRDYPAASAGLVRDGEHWKRDVAGPIAVGRRTKFLDVFTPEQQAYVRERISTLDVDALIEPAGPPRVEVPPTRAYAEGSSAAPSEGAIRGSD